MTQQDHHLLAKYRRAEEAERIMRAAGDSLLSDDSAASPIQPGWKPADPRQLRGIPVVGCVGIGGTIRDTAPTSVLAHLERAERRAHDAGALP